MNITSDGVKTLNEILQLMSQVGKTHPGYLGDKNEKTIREIILGASVGIVCKITELNRDWGVNSKGLREFNSRYSTEDYRIPYREFNWATIVKGFSSKTFLDKETIVDEKKAEEFTTLLQELKLFLHSDDYEDRLHTVLSTPVSIPWIVTDRSSDSKVFQACSFNVESFTVKYNGDVLLIGTLTDSKGKITDYELEIDNYSVGPSVLPLIESLSIHIKGGLNQVIQQNLKDREALEKQFQVFVDKYGHHAVLANL